jgi:hypothetical protein
MLIVRSYLRTYWHRLAGLGIGLTLVATLSAAASTSDVSLTGVPAGALEDRGITLRAPSSLPSATLALSDAEALAAAQIPGSSALDAKLAVVSDATQPNFGEHTAWAVSLSTTRVSGHAGSVSSARVSYTVVFLDPITGTLLFGVQAGGF